MTLDRYFEFLRFSLIDGYPVPRDLATMDWRALYNFGVRQALTGVLFLGIKKLPEGIAPPNDLLMQWVMAADRIRRQSMRASNVAIEAFRMFGEAGFRCCLLKGQGNALMYGDPYSRTSGDVDMWLCGYKDDKAPGGFVYPGIKEMRRRAVDYDTSNYEMGHVTFHHTSFKYKGESIETHFSPSVLNNPFYDRRFQQWCMERAPRESSNFVTLPDTDGGRIAVPTAHFNLVYLLVHIFHHFFDMGIGLRQLIDYYQLLMTAGEEVNRDAVRNDLRRLGLHKIAAAAVWVLGEVLGLPEEKMIVAADERRGRLLLAEILNGGNFGKYDRKYGGITRKGDGARFFTKTRRNLSFVRYFPEEALAEPVVRVWQFVWRNMHGWK
ncbi:MAG: nucleotidyltransferase family protein [Prevotella sp.]|nr:nucleotidyltransferase family protein [Prevotella sp.]